MYLVKPLWDKGFGRYTKYLSRSPYRFLGTMRKEEGYLPDTLPREGALGQIHCQSLNTHRGKHRSGGAQVNHEVHIVN